MFRVAVFGSWRLEPESLDYRLAHQIGAAAARRGIAVVTGGYSGVMSAALQGSRSAGGVAEAFTCTSLRDVLPVCSAASSVTEFDSIAERAGALVGRADACIFFPGRTGTAAELALAVEARAKAELALPLILVGDFWRPYFDWLRSSNDSLHQSADPPSTTSLFEIVHSLDDVERALDKL